MITQFDETGNTMQTNTPVNKPAGSGTTQSLASQYQDAVAAARARARDEAMRRRQPAMPPGFGVPGYWWQGMTPYIAPGGVAMPVMTPGNGAGINFSALGIPNPYAGVTGAEATVTPTATTDATAPADTVIPTETATTTPTDAASTQEPALPPKAPHVLMSEPPAWAKNLAMSGGGPGGFYTGQGSAGGSPYGSGYFVPPSGVPQVTNPPPFDSSVFSNYGQFPNAGPSVLNTSNQLPESYAPVGNNPGSPALTNSYISGNVNGQNISPNGEYPVWAGYGAKDGKPEKPQTPNQNWSNPYMNPNVPTTEGPWSPPKGNNENRNLKNPFEKPAWASSYPGVGIGIKQQTGTKNNSYHRTGMPNVVPTTNNASWVNSWVDRNNKIPNPLGDGSGSGGSSGGGSTYGGGSLWGGGGGGGGNGYNPYWQWNLINWNVR